jgi:16S rRNA (guanine527-N7)-methyltransferase
VFVELLRAKLSGVCEVSADQAAVFDRHYELLERWNRVLNLTSVRTRDEAVERHYCEGVFLACHLPVGDWSVADVGSGAGFPGIPVAVMRPDCAVTLIESHQRKAVFLREATRELGNVRVIARRAEDVRERFDWVVMRAVRYGDVAGTLKDLAERVEILSGEVSASEMAGFEWQAPVRLPWGEQRYLWIGRRLGSPQATV